MVVPSGVVTDKGSPKAFHVLEMEREDDPADSIHWLLRFPKAGTYQFEVETAAMADGDLAISVAGRSAAGTVAATGDWAKPKWSALGQVKVDESGVAHVILRAVAGKPWHAVNVFGLRATLESP